MISLGFFITNLWVLNGQSRTLYSLRHYYAVMALRGEVDWLVHEANDPQLGADLDQEFKQLSSRLPFGLNFERHRPEAVELPQEAVGLPQEAP